MSETVEALGHKADVKTRVKDSITDTKDAVVEKADSLVHKVTGAVPDGSDIKEGAVKVGEGAQRVGLSKENPLGLRSAELSASSPASCSPRPASRTRNSARPDQVIDRVKETGQDALERGKHVAQETLASAKETAVQSGAETGGNVADELKETAREVAQTEAVPRANDGPGRGGPVPVRPARLGTRPLRDAVYQEHFSASLNPTGEPVDGLSSPEQAGAAEARAGKRRRVSGVAHAAIAPRHLPTGSPRRGRGRPDWRAHRPRPHRRKRPPAGRVGDRSDLVELEAIMRRLGVQPDSGQGCTRAHRRTPWSTKAKWTASSAPH